MDFSESEVILRNLVELAEKGDRQVFALIAHGEKWIRLGMEILDQEPDLAEGEDEVTPPYRSA